MEPRFATPGALVEALHARADGARAQFQEWLREPVRRLMEEMKDRHGLEHRLERLTQYALHAAETFVRTRPPEEFTRMSSTAFRAAVLLHVAKQVVQPFGGRSDGAPPAPEPLPESEAYVCRTLYLPSEKVGPFWFGGDWYGGRTAEDGMLWVLVADVTGHGYCAYLLAQALSAIWQACWAGSALDGAEPCDVLGTMHDLLCDCLPDGVYVECTLLRLGTDGEVAVAPAGGSRLLVHSRREGRLDLVSLRGLWLGLDRPCREDQKVCTLEEGDELVAGTDGAFDQLIEHEGSAGEVTRAVGEALGADGLLEAVRQVLGRALEARPQKDDITLVQLRRRRGA